MKTEYRIMQVFGSLFSKRHGQDFATKELALAEIEKLIQHELDARRIPETYTIIEIYK